MKLHPQAAICYKCYMQHSHVWKESQFRRLANTLLVTQTSQKLKQTNKWSHITLIASNLLTLPNREQPENSIHYSCWVNSAICKAGITATVVLWRKVLLARAVVGSSLLLLWTESLLWNPNNERVSCVVFPLSILFAGCCAGNSAPVPNFGLATDYHNWAFRCFPVCPSKCREFWDITSKQITTASFQILTDKPSSHLIRHYAVSTVEIVALNNLRINHSHLTISQSIPDNLCSWRNAFK
jgi:hypothetical protein